MTTHNLMAQWMAIGKSSLDMLKKMGEAGAAQHHGEPAAQALAAKLLKSMLEMNKEWNQVQSEMWSGLMRKQLFALGSDQATQGLHRLFELQQQLSDDLASQQKGVLKEVMQRGQVCVGDLKLSQTKDDVTMVVVGFMEDLGKTLRKSSEQALTMLNSTNAASTVVAHQTLDGMIGAEKPA